MEQQTKDDTPARRDGAPVRGDRTLVRGALGAGGLAALLASACCLGPLVLVVLGVSGAWIGSLTAFEAYRPLFLCVALLALFLAYRRIFRKVEACQPGEVCAVPRVRLGYQIVFWIVLTLVLVALTFPYILPLLY